MSLSFEELRARRALDYRSMVATFAGSAYVPGFQVYRSVEDAEDGCPATTPEEAAVYDVTIVFRTTIAPAEFHFRFEFRIDTSVLGYPFVAPTVTARSEPRPWNPHVSTSGMVCLGTLMSPTKLVAHIVADLIRVLNYDEPAGNLEKSHFNNTASIWWRTTIGVPLNCVPYPVVVTPEPDEPAFGDVAVTWSTP